MATEDRVAVSLLPRDTVAAAEPLAEELPPSPLAEGASDKVAPKDCPADAEGAEKVGSDECELDTEGEPDTPTEADPQKLLLPAPEPDIDRVVRGVGVTALTVGLEVGRGDTDPTEALALAV